MKSLLVCERQTDASEEVSFFKRLWMFRKANTVALIVAALLVVSQAAHALTRVQRLQTPAGYVANTHHPYHVHHYTVQYAIPRPADITHVPSPVAPGAPRPAPHGPIDALEPLPPGTHDWRDYQVCYTREQIAAAEAALGRGGYTHRVVHSGTTVYYWMHPAGGDYRSGRWVADHILYRSVPR